MPKIVVNIIKDVNKLCIAMYLCLFIIYSVIVGSDPRSLAVGESKWDGKASGEPIPDPSKATPKSVKITLP
jgi:hypothetical protein